MKSRRCGSTLFELMLVMIILVVAAAISIPSLGSMYGSYKLNGAVDSVQSAWAEARASAINEGRSYRFSIQANGTGYRVAPDEDDYWPGEGPANDPNGKGLVLERALPTGVRFALNDASGSAPDDSNAFDLKEEKVKGANWTTAAVFKSNGFANEDVRIVFQVRGCRPMALQLRGLTGDVSVQKLPH